LSDITNICFVCLGNIVRSPLGESLFRHLTEQAGVVHQYEIDSAGTSGYHIGELPDRRMRRIAAQHGLKYTGRARQFRPRDFDHFHWIIAMDTSNQTELLLQASTPDQRVKVRLMREFDPLGGPNAVVPDPYYGGIDGFEEVYGIVDRSCKGLLNALEKGELSK
jgi:protein-tyrosine phosphatase